MSIRKRQVALLVPKTPRRSSHQFWSLAIITRSAFPWPLPPDPFLAHHTHRHLHPLPESANDRRICPAEKGNSRGTLFLACISSRQGIVHRPAYQISKSTIDYHSVSLSKPISNMSAPHPTRRLLIFQEARNPQSSEMVYLPVNKLGLPICGPGPEMPSILELPLRALRAFTEIFNQPKYKGW